MMLVVMLDKDEESEQEEKERHNPYTGRQRVQQSGWGDRVYFLGFRIISYKFLSIKKNLFCTLRDSKYI